jgi:hypothetical protein
MQSDDEIIPIWKRPLDNPTNEELKARVAQLEEELALLKKKWSARGLLLWPAIYYPFTSYD